MHHLPQAMQYRQAPCSRAYPLSDCDEILCRWGIPSVSQVRSRLQLDMRNLSLGRRHLVNAYEVEAGIAVGLIAGNSAWSMPERLESLDCGGTTKSALYKYTYLYLVQILT